MLCLCSSSSHGYNNLESANRPDSNTSYQKTYDASLVHRDSLFYRGVYFNNINKHDSALIVLDKFSKFYPGIPATYFQMARAHIGKNSSWKVIEELINKAYSLDPQNKWYMMYYAQILAFKGNHLEAANTYSNLIDKGIYDKEVFINALVNYYKVEKYDTMFRVIDLMDRYTSYEDEFIELLKISVYKSKKDFAGIEEIYKKKAEAGTLLLSDKLELYELFRKEKLIDKKNEVLKSIDYFSITERDDRLSLLYNLTLKYEHDFVNGVMDKIFSEDVPVDTMRFNEFKEYFIEAFLENPRSVRPYFETFADFGHNNKNNYLASDMMAEYYQVLQLEDSVKFYSIKSFEQGSMAIGNFYRVCLASLAVEKYDQLNKDIQTALDRNPKYALAHYFKSVMHYNKGEKKEALNAIDKCVQFLNEQGYSDVFSSTVHSLFADLLQTSLPMDTAKIIKHYDISLDLNPKNYLCLNNYAYFLSNIQKNLDFALEMSKRTIDNDPSNANSLDTYAWILYQLGRYEEARTYLEMAVNLNEDVSTVVLEHLADVEVKLNNTDNAIKYYKMAIDRAEDGDNDKVIEIKKKLKKYE